MDGKVFPMKLGRRALRPSHSSVTVAIPTTYFNTVNQHDILGMDIFMNGDLTLTLKPIFRNVVNKPEGESKT